MIDDMYAVMERINQLRTRFGLKRHNPSVSMNENQHKDNSYGEIQKKLLNSGTDVKSTELSAGKNSGKNSKENINQIAEVYAKRNQISPDLVKAVINVESSYNPYAVSPAGAKGLMQLMPSVMKDYGVSNPFNPGENIEAGSSHLSKLLKDYDGDYKKALAAYNAGKGAVTKYNGVPDYRETKNYISQVIDLYKNNEK